MSGRGRPSRETVLVHAFFCAIAVCTVGVLFNVLGLDRVPFAGEFTFEVNRTFERSALGYAALPPVDPAGGFEPFNNGFSRIPLVDYCFSDEPYWPDGDPGLGANNPLPRFVRRNELYGIHPAVPAAALSLGWMGWALMFVRMRRKQAALACPGFAPV